MSLNFALTHQLIGWDGQRAYAGLCALALAVNVGLNARLIPAWSIEGAAWATLATELCADGRLRHRAVDRARAGTSAARRTGRRSHEVVTTREIAIARSVIYASLFDYPLTLEQLHYALIESDQTRPEILAVYEGSELLHDIVEYRDGFFFPTGRGDLIEERRRREARSDRFLDEHRLVLRLICALPFTRLVALSGSIAHRNLEPNGDLDLFIVTRGPRVWTVTVMLLVLTRLLRSAADGLRQLPRRRHAPGGRSAGSVHGQPGHPPAAAGRRRDDRALPRGEPVRGALLSEQHHGPAAAAARCRRRPRRRLRQARAGNAAERAVAADRAGLPPSCTRGTCSAAPVSWRSPDQVRLQSDYLKLHTRSHRHAVHGTLPGNR